MPKDQSRQRTEQEARALALDESLAPIHRSLLRDATLRGLRWVAGGRVLAEVLTVVSSVILARLIAPAEFGVVAVAMTVNVFAAVLATGGLGQALVQRATISHRHVEAAAAMCALSGLALSALVFAAAPAVAGLLGDRTAEGIRFVSPVLLLFSLGATSTAVLQRRLDFRSVTTADVVAALVGVAVSVGLALAGWDAEAILAGTLARAATQSGVAWYFVRPPRPRWHRREARELAGFGVATAMASVGYQGTQNVDYAIVGAQLGLTQVGLYWRAYQMAFEYQSKVTLVMQKVALPVLSRTRDLEDIRVIRYRMVRVHGVIIFPLLFLFIAVAPDLIPWLYGAPWRDAVVPAQILAIGAFTAPVLAGLGALILAVGRPNALVAANWLSAATYAGVVFICAQYSLIAVCVGVVAHAIVKLIVVHHFLLGRLVGIRMRQIATDSAPAMVSGLVLLGIAVMTVHGLGALSAPTAVTLGLATVFGGIAYLATLRLVFHDAWEDFLLVLERVAIGRASERLRERAPGAAAVLGRLVAARQRS
jgi:PST family polysaccharide transporter